MFKKEKKKQKETDHEVYHKSYVSRSAAIYHNSYSGIFIQNRLMDKQGDQRPPFDPIWKPVVTDSGARRPPRPAQSAPRQC